MFMKIVRSEVFGAQQGDQHVDRHAYGGGDVEGGDDHDSDAPEQNGEHRKQREHARAHADVDEIHGSQLRLIRRLLYVRDASRFGAYAGAGT